jgi:acyl-coenzyme A synthetase/AMP-(fatty) acid ligase
VVGPRQARLAAAALRWAPRAIQVDVAELVSAPVDVLPEAPGAGDHAAVLFTSGATGAAKGVRYTHGQLAAQRDALASTYAIAADDRLVAAFAPFALYGPALGIPTALPDVDVTKPGELTAGALDAACSRIGATLAFASPAALANVVASAASGVGHVGLNGLRVVFSAGAPVPSETLRAIGSLAPGASLHTPYGMTEVLPVTDIDLVGIEQAELDDPAGGVCVGLPVEGAEVRIAALGFDPEDLPAELDTGTTGEILVRAPWVSAGYLGLWATERAARPGAVGDWHRSGDVGHLDALGRLWVEGRAVHVIDGPDGPITSVPIERSVERALGVRRSAAVGVGPVGSQQLVIVIEDPAAGDGPADSDVAATVRRAVTAPVASVLTASKLPVDIRHNAKIDRAEVGEWASEILAGRRLGRLTRRW